MSRVSIQKLPSWQSFLTLDGATPLESTHHIWAVEVQLILESLVLHYEETEDRQTLHTLDDSGVLKLTVLVSLRQGLD